ncbi:MAG: hypothetical protein ACI9QC_000472, partial [Oceanicoccus sp.]
KEVKVLCKLDDGVLASEVTSIDTLGWATTEEKI